eukprot:TRINITY_DN3531_c0_g7_i1.p1 TRINITY_DN3531_c0_g7~~TRINITY_DN3531_c0_g7_i1.p1  ORF type:complete len:641 (+),score=108.71 TRINITY_DN3531_c0_g7_i1:40-1923(+)
MSPGEEAAAAEQDASWSCQNEEERRQGELRDIWRSMAESARDEARGRAVGYRILAHTLGAESGEAWHDQAVSLVPLVLLCVGLLTAAAIVLGMLFTASRETDRQQSSRCSRSCSPRPRRGDSDARHQLRAPPGSPEHVEHTHASEPGSSWQSLGQQQCHRRLGSEGYVPPTPATAYVPSGPSYAAPPPAITQYVVTTMTTSPATCMGGSPFAQGAVPAHAAGSASSYTEAPARYTQYSAETAAANTSLQTPQRVQGMLPSPARPTQSPHLQELWEPQLRQPLRLSEAMEQLAAVSLADQEVRKGSHSQSRLRSRSPSRIQPRSRSQMSAAKAVAKAAGPAWTKVPPSWTQAVHDITETGSLPDVLGDAEKAKAKAPGKKRAVSLASEPTSSSATPPAAKAARIASKDSKDSAASSTPAAIPGLMPAPPDSAKLQYFVVRAPTLAYIQTSVREGAWATSRFNTDILADAFEKSDHVVLIFTATHTGNFLGYGVMTSAPDSKLLPGVWGKMASGLGDTFKVKWIKQCVLPFSQTDNLRNTGCNHTGCPLSKSRDGREVPAEFGAVHVRLLYQQKDEDLLSLPAEDVAEEDEAAEPQRRLGRPCEYGVQLTGTERSARSRKRKKESQKSL